MVGISHCRYVNIIFFHYHFHLFLLLLLLLHMFMHKSFNLDTRQILTFMTLFFSFWCAAVGGNCYCGSGCFEEEGQVTLDMDS